jgi:hypothetical protein
MSNPAAVLFITTVAIMVALAVMVAGWCATQ